MSEDFLRLKTTPKPATPSQGAVDLFYDKTAGVFKTRDFDGPAKSLVSGDGTGITDAAAFTAALAAAASSGGIGATDAGKLAKLDLDGGMKFGSATEATAALKPIVDIRGTTGFILNVTHHGNGFAIEAAAATSTTGGGFSTHLNGPLAQIALQIDGTGAGTGSYGVQCVMDASAGPGVSVADGSYAERINLMGDGVIRFTASAHTDASRVDLSAPTATALRSIILPDQSGTIPAVPQYADLTAANAALASGDFWWDTTLKKLRTATA